MILQGDIPVQNRLVQALKKKDGETVVLRAWQSNPGYALAAMKSLARAAEALRGDGEGLGGEGLVYVPRPAKQRREGRPPGFEALVVKVPRQEALARAAIPVRRLRVATSSPVDKVVESIVFDLTHYGVAEVSASQQAAVASMTTAMILARGVLLKKGFELGAMPSLERTAVKQRGGADAGEEAAGKKQEGSLVVVNRLVATDLPPPATVLPDNFSKMGKAVERARRTLGSLSRVELAVPAFRVPQLFDALAAIEAEPLESGGNRRLLLLSPDQLVSGPSGAATRRLFFLSTSRFQKVPSMAAATRAARHDGLVSTFTATSKTRPEDLAAALVAVVTNCGLLRVVTDGSRGAAAAAAEALVAAGDKLREHHSGTRLCALADAEVPEAAPADAPPADGDAPPAGGDGGSSGGAGAGGMGVTLLVTQQNAISSALLQRPSEPLAALVERPGLARVLRTAAAMNLIMAERNGAGSLLLLPTEVGEELAAPGGGERAGGRPFSLRVQRVPQDRSLPKREAGPRAMLRVRDGLGADRLAAEVVEGVVAGEHRQLEVREASLLPLALQALSMARAQLLEKGSGLELAAVVYVSRRPLKGGAAEEGAAAEEGPGAAQEEEEDEEGEEQEWAEAAAASAAEGAEAAAEAEEERDAVAEAAAAEVAAADVAEGASRPHYAGKWGPPVYTLRLVTLEAQKEE